METLLLCCALIHIEIKGSVYLPMAAHFCRPVTGDESLRGSSNSAYSAHPAEWGTPPDFCSYLLPAILFNPHWASFVVYDDTDSMEVQNHLFNKVA